MTNLRINGTEFPMI